MNRIAAVLVLLPLITFARSFSLMTYNAENLFNTKHDEGKEDWTYLPLAFKQGNDEVTEYCSSLNNPVYRRSCFETDWSSETLKAKLTNLAKVIRSYDDGKGPDIIVLQEIENVDVMRLLANNALKQMGYRYGSLIEGPDTRGIDVGLISKYRITNRKYHQIDLSSVSKRKTRGILETVLDIHGKSVSIFANHWPSQANKDETRLIASKVLLQAVRDSRSDVRIAAGDFNTLTDDKPHGIKQNILPFFTDIEAVGRKPSEEKAPGTHWYRGKWSSLDRIFLFKEDTNEIRINLRSFDIIAHRFMLREVDEVRSRRRRWPAKLIPMRFNVEKREGFSDHLPVTVKFDLKK